MKNLSVKLSQIFNKNKLLVYLLLLGFLLRLFLSIQIYSGDVNNHIAWGYDIYNFGTQGVYSREFFSRYGTLPPTYPPIPLYLFTASYVIFELAYKTSWSLNSSVQMFPSNLIFFFEDQDTLPAFLKLPGIFSDLLLAGVVYFFTKKILGSKDNKFPLIASSLILFNPAFFYNSSFWGQIESIPLSFLLLSIYLLLFSKRNFLSTLFFVLAIITKQTTIIFIPIFAIVFFKKHGMSKSIKSAIFSLLVFWLSFFPFFKEGNILTFPFETYLNKIQTGSGSIFVTDHAFNFWALTTGLGKIEDTQILYLLNFRTWGYIIFFVFLGIILINLIKAKSDRSVLLALFLTSLAAFLFLTRMHERYLLQALPFLLLMGVKSRKLLWTFAFMSVFYFLNLYHNWWAPRIPVFVKLLSSNLFINTLIVILMAVFFVYLIKYPKEIGGKK